MRNCDALSGLRLTPGVELVDGTLVCEGLGVTLPLSVQHARSVALELGMASGYDGPPGRLKQFRISYRSDKLESPIISAILQAIRYHCVSMSYFGAGAAGLIVIGVLMGWPSLLALGLLVALLATSIIAHELGHVIAFRLVAGAGQVAHIVTHGMSIALVRRPLARWAELLVVLAGPFGPLLLSLVTIPVYHLQSLIWCAWFVIAAGHVVTLVFPVGDGSNLRMALELSRN